VNKNAKRGTIKPLGFWMIGRHDKLLLLNKGSSQ
jgi:hypothetical protein